MHSIRLYPHRPLRSITTILMDPNSSHVVSESETILGLDVGGSKTVVVEGSRDARILQRREVPTEGARPFEQTFQRIRDLTELTITAAASTTRTTIAHSASVPSP